MLKLLNKIFRKKLPTDLNTPIVPCSVRIKIEDVVSFAGTVESFNISTNLQGSDANVIIKFKANDLLRELFVREEEE